MYGAWGEMFHLEARWWAHVCIFCNTQATVRVMHCRQGVFTANEKRFIMQKKERRTAFDENEEGGRVLFAPGAIAQLIHHIRSVLLSTRQAGQVEAVIIASDQMTRTFELPRRTCAHYWSL